MRILYNILFWGFFLVSSPYYFWRLVRRGNWLAGFGERFGQFDTKFKQSITNRHRLWLHAVSVGEVNLCAQLIRSLEPRLPNAKFIVSTTTTTGMGELKRKLPAHIGKIYYPVDRLKYVTRALASVSPQAVILVEAEIWPNFIWRANAMGIPLFLANARLSERSYRGYRRFAFLFRPLFASFTGVGAQSAADAARLQKVGFRPETIQQVGSLKFDAAQRDELRTLDVAALLAQLGVAADAPVLVCGSTHAGEEAVLADIYLRLQKRFPELFLIVVPRHFERSRDAGRELATRGVKFALRSKINGQTRFAPGELHGLLVNTTGELQYFYERATVVFVGKSLTAQGGQNPIEPAALGKAVVVGPNMQNFTDVVEIFRAQDAVVQVRDAAELEVALAELLFNQARREQLGRNALQVVHENHGAVDRTVEMILKGIEKSGMYITPKR